MQLPHRLLPALLAALAAAAASAQVQRTPDAALQALQDGNHRFVHGTPAAKPVGPGPRRTLAGGASPLAVVVACADAPAAPELVFDAALGELVVARTAGHVVSPELVAAVEQAVAAQATPLCVVLAHDGCAPIAAALAQADAAPAVGAHGPAMAGVLTAIEPAVHAVDRQRLAAAVRARACEEEHAQLTAQAILRQSELLRQRAAEGRFRIVAARCQLRAGVVDWRPARPLPPDPAAAAAAARTAPPNAPPHVALRVLQAGHQRFLSERQPTGDTTAARREALADGEQPFAVVLACADARVAPERLFDLGLGDVCVVRLPGGALTDDALAAVEHAVRAHGAPLLIALGHTRCDALRAAATAVGDPNLSPSQRALARRLEAAVVAAQRTASGDDAIDLAARLQAQRVVAEARARSALLRAAEDDGRLLALGCVYDVASGDLAWLTNTAAAATAAPHAPIAGHRAGGDGHGHDDHDAPAPTHAAPAGETAPPRPAATEPDHGHAPAPGHGGAATTDHGAHGTHGHTDERAPAKATAGHDDHGAAAAGHGRDHSHGATTPAAPSAAKPTAGVAAPVWLAAGLGIAGLALCGLLLLRRRG
jgi:carbonic anhydrase